MDAKFKFKTHTYHVFYFIFGAVFCAFGLKALKKYKHDLKNLKNKIKKGIKNAEFLADFKFVEKVLKIYTKKVLSKTSLTNMSKSGKSTFLLITFFWNIFENFFNRFEISVKFCVFLYP
jgi:hypothetical protein